MIRINLLPPEYRRRRTSRFDPRWAAGVAGVLIVVAIAGLWLWVEMVRIPAAKALKAQREQELAEATARADKVREIDKQITDFEQLHRTITGLITRKVLWARTLDDFANLLAQHDGHRWTRDGFEARCTSLAIAAAGSAAASGRRQGGVSIDYTVRANIRLIGEQRDMVGDYIQSFFRTVEASRFWREHGFAGYPDINYRGETPRLSPETGKVIVDLPLEWRRSKVLAAAPAAGGQR